MSKSKKSIGLKQWIKKIIQEEGGGGDGGGLFKVTLSQNLEDTTKLDADKSYNEILSAINAGDVVIGSLRVFVDDQVGVSNTSFIQWMTGALNIELDGTNYICLSGSQWTQRGGTSGQPT